MGFGSGSPLPFLLLYKQITMRNKQNVHYVSITPPSHYVCQSSAKTALILSSTALPGNAQDSKNVLIAGKDPAKISHISQVAHWKVSNILYPVSWQLASWILVLMDKSCWLYSIGNFWDVALAPWLKNHHLSSKHNVIQLAHSKKEHIKPIKRNPTFDSRRVCSLWFSSAADPLSPSFLYSSTHFLRSSLSWLRRP